MKGEFEYKKDLLKNPTTVKVGKNKPLFEIISNKHVFDYYSDAASSDTTGFVIEITDVLSEDVRKILAGHKIKIGDIIYFEFREDDENRKRAYNLKKDALQMAANILDNKEDYNGLKSTAFTFVKMKPFNDYKIGKLELMSPWGPYDVRDGFFINDSIAEKIVGNIYAVPEMVLKKGLKLVKHKNDDLEMER